MTFSVVTKTLFILSVTMLAAVEGFNLLEDIARDIKMEIAAVARPVETHVMGVLSEQCALVKNMFGLQYDQMKGVAEPDVTQLTLEFTDSVERVIFKIPTAATDILKSHIYHPNEKLTLFVHGFTDDPTKDSFQITSEAFRKIGYYKVLALDGSSLIGWLYLRSTTYVTYIGETLGTVLAAMVEGGLHPKKIHMIGHSLGAHVCGFTGKSFYKITGKRIGRISGLDPAGPCFVGLDKKMRLTKTDANFVDIMHTDSGVFGMTDPIGHVDFYPNGGNKQPGCVMSQCDHNRAWLFYAASVVYPNAFPAVKCQDWDAFKEGNCDHEISQMGYGCAPTARGTYYLQTSDSYPYGLGENGTKFDNDEALVDIFMSVTQSLI